jgi:hypothetical protein
LDQRRLYVRYLILLWGDRAGEEALSPDERRAIVERHMELSERLRADGKLVHGDPLAPGGKVVRDGLVTDGPFVETIAIANEMPRSPGLVAEVLPTSAV